jgi:hypothetical protein
MRQLCSYLFARLAEGAGLLGRLSFSESKVASSLSGALLEMIASK